LENNKNKLLQKLTEAELLKILSEPSDDNVTPVSEDESARIRVLNSEQSDDIVRFLAFYDIQPGNHIISTLTLRKLYNSWTKQYPKPSFKVFKRSVSKYLLPMRYPNSESVYYLINKDTYSVEEENQKLREKKHKAKIYTYKRNNIKHFQNFLDYYDIRAGKVYIEMFLLYYIYDKWVSKNNTKYRLSEPIFSDYCTLYFPKHLQEVTRRRVFGINKTILEIISEEELNQIYEGRKRRYAQTSKAVKERNRKAKESTKQAREGEISSLKARIKLKDQV
jgi:hypothetical protein